MATTYEIIIGLEVHVQLMTESKLFCSDGTKFGEPPNTLVSPVSIGMPGVLPVMNRRALELAIKAGLALGCQISRFTKWDRKHYFYPDLPKAYQISQYDIPLATEGLVTYDVNGEEKKCRLIRVHLEEDAGKNLHAEGGGDSLVDLNRAGMPLIEVVSYPDIRRPEEAAAYLETIRTLMRDLDVSDCEMQEGSLRCDANINLHITKDGNVYKTPIVEVKNLNSIKSVEKSLIYEASRQFEQWQKDGKVLGQMPKQTRGWDDARGITRSQREKEEEADYRYFPEPDLVPVVIDDALIERIRGEFGETSAQRKKRYIEELGLNDYNASVLIDKGRAISDYFEALLTHEVDAKSAANWLINDVLSHAEGRIKVMSDLPIMPGSLAELIKLVKGNKLNLNDAREKVLPEMIETGRDAASIVDEKGLGVVLDTAAIDAIVDAVLADNAKIVEDIKSGKGKALGALVGQVMKRSQGKFPPAIVNETLNKRLGL
ncbi:Asp-tRNA(Asn)/Glu-tRNA(Gln) amidotransferase subunit GatB [bacterium]|nr:Asp-tRNA(Asn)/Glu-tRNA(Gln) amidotransferase subunit GatB [bacterium]